MPAFPGTLANARYVHVASYDGGQFDPNLLSEDRDAIGRVPHPFASFAKGWEQETVDCMTLFEQDKNWSLVRRSPLRAKTRAKDGAPGL